MVKSRDILNLEQKLRDTLEKKTKLKDFGYLVLVERVLRSVRGLCEYEGGAGGGFEHSRDSSYCLPTLIT
jgi:hypothetical protein